MTEKNFDILNSVALVDVMRGWGHTPQRMTRSGEAAWYVCPWHDDHRPSLEVRTVPMKGATDLGFKCWACGQEGFGAVQLAARLMGLPAGQVPKEDLPMVLRELAERCDVELEPEEDGKPWRDNLRVAVVGWDKFCEAEPQWSGLKDGEAEFERGEWTEEGLKALGFKIELASRRAKKADSRPTPDPSLVGRGVDTAIPEETPSAEVTTPLHTREGQGGGSVPEIKVGDMLTQYDPDTGEPLYRCSVGKDFYRGPLKAETRTISKWGEEVERLFGVEPIKRFFKRDTPKQGGAVVIQVRTTRNYPMFIFRYAWGVKKYEPRASYGGSKWTWWNVSEDAALDTRWYADAPLLELLQDGVIPDKDERHPLVETTVKDKDGNDLKDKQGEVVKKQRFERVVICSGPRDAMAVWSHSNAHVVWLHSEQAGFNNKGGNVRPNRWLRSLLRKLQGVTVDGGLYVCYDEDDTGLAASQAIALNSPNVRWLRLPKELSEIAGRSGKSGNSGQPDKPKHLKDVTDFITRFAEVEGRMPADLQHDDPVEWFDNALFDTPTTQFWQWESERKDADGTGRARYKFDLRNTPVFLRARGMVRQLVQTGDEAFSRFFLMGNDHTYTEFFPGMKGGPNKLVAQARELMAEWLRAHKEYNDAKGALSRAIYSAKLEQGTLESIETMPFDEKSYGEDFDHFFFENTAVRVTKDGIEQVPYSQMRWWTNREAILPGEFRLVQQPWHVEVAGFYESERQKHEDILRSLSTTDERKQENMRWDAWAALWKYRLVMDKPLEEMPMHFQFLYNTSRIFWEKEQAGEELNKTERQVQDMYFIAMCHAIGSALVRHRSASRQQFIHITDNGTPREDLASGGTGKTVILELMGLVRRVLKMDGKALEGSNITLEQELGKVVPGLHNIVCIDELPAGFSPKKMYNVTLSVTSRGLYKASVKLEGDDVPKFALASNEQIDLSSDSTNRRTYQVLVSDWYHPRTMDGARQAHTPADDFRAKYGIKEVARNLPPALLNEGRNFLLGCVRLFLTFPDETLTPPRDSRALLRQALAASKDEQFTRWIAAYLADKRHIGEPIAQRELAISLLDYCGIVVGEKTLKSAYKRIRDNLEDYLRTSVYVVNPPVVLLTPTDREKGFRRCAAWQHTLNPDGTIASDSQGNRLPRELEKKMQPRVYYFYRKGYVPRHFYEEGHEGDKDWVQAASEKDPEREETTNKSNEN